MATSLRGDFSRRYLGRIARRSTPALSQAYGIAPVPVQVFTDGLEPERISRNRFALSSWGNFSTRFSPFSAHVATVTTTTVPRTWAQDNATIYVTYPLQSQGAVGPLAAALIAGLVRQLLTNPRGKRVLFAIDEMPTVGLPNLSSYLATVGGAGITLVLYAQALPQIEDVYGRQAALSILSNCTSQLFFPPLEAAEVMALPEGSLILFSRGLRHIVQDSRQAVLGWLPALPTAPTAQAAPIEAKEAVETANRTYW